MNIDFIKFSSWLISNYVSPKGGIFNEYKIQKSLIISASVLALSLCPIIASRLPQVYQAQKLTETVCFS